MLQRVAEAAATTARRTGEFVAAWLLQGLPTEAAFFANFPWGRGSKPARGERGSDDAGQAGKRRRGSRRRRPDHTVTQPDRSPVRASTARWPRARPRGR